MTDRQALWEKFTSGEKLAYGCGFRDARAEALDARVLAQAIERACITHNEECWFRASSDRGAESIAREYAAIIKADREP